jgi:hypothetical protein
MVAANPLASLAAAMAVMMHQVGVTFLPGPVAASKAVPAGAHAAAKQCSTVLYWQHVSACVDIVLSEQQPSSNGGQ